MSADRLPHDYLAWLDRVHERGPHYVRFRGRDWDLADRERLASTVQLNRDKVIYHSQLSAYVKMFTANGSTAADGPRGKPFEYERLVRGVVLGSDNEDLLFADPDDGYSLWRLMPSESRNGEVDKVAKTLVEFMTKAVIEDVDLDDE